MVADAGEIEEPPHVLGERDTACRETGCVVFEPVGGLPLLLGRNVSDRTIGEPVGCLKDRDAVEPPVWGSRISLCAIPRLAPGIGFLEQAERFDVPITGIGPIRLGFDVVPPHELLAGGVGPGRFAGHRACLASDAAVDVEHCCELTLSRAVLEPVVHGPPQMPVVYLSHRLSPRTRSRSGHPQRFHPGGA